MIFDQEKGYGIINWIDENFAFSSSYNKFYGQIP